MRRIPLAEELQETEIDLFVELVLALDLFGILNNRRLSDCVYLNWPHLTLLYHKLVRVNCQSGA